jgi:hypothetical protein
MIKLSTLLSVSLAAGAILMSASASQAVPIYVQMAPSPDQEFLSDSHADAGDLTADNFTLGVSDTIRSVIWQGTSGPSAPGPDAFRIVFYADPIGSPLASFNVGTAFRFDTGTAIGGDELYSYEANLGGAGFAAAAGTHYWISIVNDAIVDPANAWAWAGTFNGLASGSFDNGATWFIQAGQTQFALGNDTVPEPATVSLVVLGLIGLAGARTRRRR